MEDLIKNIDYRMLTSQKQTLLKLQENPVLSQREKDVIEGIINLIDTLQDKAVDSKILTEAEVFPYLNTEENENN
jgi:predicted ATPase